ncbi:PGDYG domain-containing protein [Altibacter sp.]|uniref:PGDYG domain-containing protein n=1 Tax=Altibacter sp. TaxID=2024823 RepID=UPI000C96D125|nr:PGDYG domain-containing protein [Altibacter sp.]MAP55332.1 hypothetical protein [Altibacter sp.]
MRTIDANNTEGLVFQKAIKKPLVIECLQIAEAFQVETMEGTMRGKPGDWLMKGVNGELYVCDHAIFEKTYDLIK